MPPLQPVMQQSLGCEQGAPMPLQFGAQACEQPRTPTACFTHSPNQLVEQQNGSIAQVLATQGSHAGDSAAPGMQ
jgi:hypothetical protein